MLSDAKLLGKWGEKRCEMFLKKKGLRNLARNFSCACGEIDLVMADADGTIVFVEVKTRASEDFEPVESVITPAKKAKLTRTAHYFLKTYNINNRPCRFDIAAIVIGQTGPEQIRHYENAFVP